MDTAALKASWGKVAAAGDDVPLYFYSHLFLSHPEVRSMFPIQMTAQREKLVTALGAVVSNVESLDDVVPLLEQLGRDHRRFAVVYGALFGGWGKPAGHAEAFPRHIVDSRAGRHMGAGVRSRRQGHGCRC